MTSGRESWKRLTGSTRRKSPFNDWKLKGWPVTTIVEGNVVYEDGKIMARTKRLIGWAVLLLISLLPAIQWYFFGTFRYRPLDYANITHSLGQLAALTGMTMFALNFVLSTRIRPVDEAFGGLDKAYAVHAALGGTALVLLLAHPILLVLKFIPNEMNLAADFLMPSKFLSVNLGIIALTGLAALLYITFYTGMKYNRWKISHKFLGMVFAIAVLHMFLVRNTAARDHIFSGYYIYASAVSAIGLGAFLYSLLLRSRKSQSYEIESIRKWNDQVYDITMKPAQKPMKYKSGQFVFLKFFNKKVGKEEHPFSIASSTNNPLMRVVIKNLGDFTSKLDELKAGDKVSVEGPYGRFHYDESHKTGQVWVAGGIGVTPFIGMAQDLAKAKPEKGVDMYYTVSKKEDFIALDELESAEKATKGKFRIMPWVTAEKGRITVKDIQEKSGNLEEKDFYLCGPGGLKQSISEQLAKAGVPKSKIFEEDFNFR